MCPSQSKSSLPLNNGLPTIALLVGSMASNYHEGIMRGVAYVAEQRNYNLIGYCGGVIKPHNERVLSRDSIFDLVDLDLISGVISPFSSNGRFLSQSDLMAFIDRFSGVPVVNIGSEIDKYTSVSTDYRSGFIEIFKHFYEDHGFRNIALVRGPEHHATSEVRTQLYKELCQQYQLEVNDDLIVYANLRRDATREVMLDYLSDYAESKRCSSSGKPPIDAIITTSDNQAMGVISACNELGLRVPEDIAVVGSMDTLEGNFFNPPLSSVREPLFELGQAAANELIDQIEGKAASNHIRIPTSLVVRQSCGCSGTQLSNQDESELLPMLQTQGVSCSESAELENILTELETAARLHKGGIFSQRVAELVTNFHIALNTDDFDNILELIQSSIDKETEADDSNFWLKVAAYLQSYALEHLRLNKTKHALLVFTSALTQIKNRYDRTAIRFQSYETEYYLNHFRTILNELNSSFDLKAIQKYTIETFKLTELYISIFEDEKRETAESIVSIRDTKSVDIDNPIFNSKHLLPSQVPQFKERYALLALPISFANKPIGFMISNLSSRRGTAFENLRAIISSSLKNEMLIQELSKAERRFSDIAHSTSNWLWETDSEHALTYCSNSTDEIIGYPAEALVGTNINQLNIDPGASYYEAMLKHDPLSDIECWYTHRDGRLVCLLVSAIPIIKDDRFHGYRGVFEDITEQRLQEDKIKHLAYTDVLTGLPNRTQFQDSLQATIQYSTASSKRFALMFIDLDHFKYVNDTLGHAAGDQLLCKLSEKLRDSIRTRDIIARIGGDEFVVILPDISSEQEVIEVTKRIFDNLEEELIICDRPIYPTLSMGISVYPNDGLDAETLLMHGDSAMYQAKSQGRNGYAFYNKLFEEKSMLRSANEAILRDAISAGSFELHYQAQLSVETRNIMGFETLLRIRHPELGLIAPGSFIGLAEELGLIRVIDEWVFEHACIQHQRWKREGRGEINLSVNLSPLQLKSSKVVATYLALMRKYQVDPRYITLEITESALIDNENEALAILKSFKKSGVKIALDDFGTGYSSLSCISAFPIDCIKIDRSFVSDVIDNPKNRAIIEATILIAKQLGLDIVAEGVETSEQFDEIKRLGCHQVQGYYFYKPLALEAVESGILEQSRPRMLVC